MYDDVMMTSKLQVGIYDITVRIIQDYDIGLLEHTDMATEVRERDLPSSVYISLVEHGATMAINNDTHEVYVKASYARYDHFFVLRDNLKEVQKSILESHAKTSEVISKNDAWLLAMKYAKHDADYICGYYNDDWSFVGIDTEVIATKTDDSGLIWSREVENIDSSCWGIEWSLCWGDSPIDNKDTFKTFIPELLPGEIGQLNDGQLNTLWLNLE